MRDAMHEAEGRRSIRKLQGGNLELDKFRTGQIWSRKNLVLFVEKCPENLVRFYSQKSMEIFGALFP